VGLLRSGPPARLARVADGRGSSPSTKKKKNKNESTSTWMNLVFSNYLL
jgi:hypothetical protein